MFAKLFLIFAILPILEIALLINVGEQIGGWKTVGLVILTAFVGAYFVRREGLSTLFNAQRKMHMGGVPGQEMAEGLLLVIAGVLLVTPGFITDIVGFLLSMPFSRPAIAKMLMKKVNVHVVGGAQPSGFYQHQQQQWQQPQSQHSQNGDIIEGEFERTDPHSGERITNNDNRDKP